MQGLSTTTAVVSDLLLVVLWCHINSELVSYEIPWQTAGFSGVTSVLWVS